MKKSGKRSTRSNSQLKNRSVAKPTIPAQDSRWKDHPYLNLDGTLDGLRLFKFLADSPGGTEPIMIQEFMLKGHIEPQHRDTAAIIIKSLLGIVLRASQEDEEALCQLQALSKFADPERYEIGPADIKEIARKFRMKPAIARACEIRELMSSLLHVVELIPNQRSAKTRPEARRVRLQDTVHPDPWITALRARADKHCKPGSTLQSLAIELFLASLAEQELRDGIDLGTLKRDLRDLRSWEKTNAKNRHHIWGLSIGDDQITWYRYSDDWKQLKRKKQIGRAK